MILLNSDLTLALMKPKKSTVEYGVEDCEGFGTQRWTWDGKLIARVTHRIKRSSFSSFWFELFSE